MEDRKIGSCRHRRAIRVVRPALEDLETRKLMSVSPELTHGQHLAPTSLIQAAEASGGTGGSGTANGGGEFTMPNPGTALLGQGPPSRHELARQRFKAYFQGPVTVGPGRFSDQGKTIYIRGIGGSNTFRHGDLNMAIVIPKDPTAPLSGEAVLQDKNINSAGIIGLVLMGDPRAVDRVGRPNHLTFTNDDNIYSGIFFVDSSDGTVDIHYSKGSATVRFNGLVYTTGLTSPLRNSDLYARGGRITPRSGR